MKKKQELSQKLVKHIANKRFVKANEVLNALIQKKIDERVEEVLSNKEKNS